MDIHLGIVNNIRSHTGEGNGQTVETHRVGITHAQLLEQGTDILALDETTASLALTTEGKRTGDDVGALFLAVTNALTTDVLTVAEQESPVEAAHQRIEGLGIVANGIEAAHKTTHRGSRHDINGDASAFQHLQGTDMRRTLCATATQYDGDFLALRSGRLFLRKERKHGEQEHQGANKLLHLSERLKGIALGLEPLDGLRQGGTQFVNTFQ